MVQFRESIPKDHSQCLNQHNNPNKHYTKRIDNILLKGRIKTNPKQSAQIDYYKTHTSPDESIIDS